MCCAQALLDGLEYYGIVRAAKQVLDFRTTQQEKVPQVLKIVYISQHQFWYSIRCHFSSVSDLILTFSIFCNNNIVKVGIIFGSKVGFVFIEK